MTETTGTQNAIALKHGDTFLVADVYGDVTGQADGYFSDDTRLVSTLLLTIGSERPSLLGSGVSADNVIFHAHLTNRPLPPIGGESAPEGIIHVERSRFLWERRLYERVTLRNYG